MGHKHRDAVIDLWPQIAGGGIERVVEIKDPRLNMRKCRPCFFGQQLKSRIILIGNIICGFSCNGSYLVISVPAPPSVSSSTSTAWGV